MDKPIKQYHILLEEAVRSARIEVKKRGEALENVGMDVVQFYLMVHREVDNLSKEYIERRIEEREYE